MNRTLDVVTSLAATLARAASGGFVTKLGRRPQQPLVVYEFESCPYCRKVREALSMLDLDADILPCPKGGTLFRPELRERGGKEQFPYLVDPNTGKEMYESDAIVRYLFETYGDGQVPWLLSVPVLKDVTAQLASAWRPTRGIRVAKTKKRPAGPLELYSFEASPFCRIVREALCSLELPYTLHNVAKGSPSREAFEARSGRMQVPYLIDPNTQLELFESADIVAYLESTYGE